jgi:MFS family permease
VETAFSFVAAVVSLRLAAGLVRGRDGRRRSDTALWAASLVSFAAASAALAWASAAGWDDRSFRVYYLFGGLLAAPLLGAGSLARVGWKPARSLALLYTGLAVGVALAEPLSGLFPETIPAAQDHFDLWPARIIAIVGNGLGTLAFVVVCLVTMRGRILANALLLAGVGVAAVGSTLAGLGVAASAASLAVASLLLYAGVAAPGPRRSQPCDSSQSPPTV